MNFILVILLVVAMPAIYICNEAQQSEWQAWKNQNQIGFPNVTEDQLRLFCDNIFYTRFPVKLHI